MSAADLHPMQVTPQPQRLLESSEEFPIDTVKEYPVYIMLWVQPPE